MSEGVMEEVRPKVEEKQDEVHPMVEFFQKFRESDDYKRSFKEWMETRSNSNGATEDEWKEIFEERDEARYALDDFEKDHSFHFDPEAYPAEVQQPITAYFNSVAAGENAIRMANQRYNFAEDRKIKIAEIDRRRQRRHDSAAEALVQHGYAPNQQLGRQLLGLMLAGEDESKRNEASLSVADKVQRQNGSLPQK